MATIAISYSFIHTGVHKVIPFLREPVKCHYDENRIFSIEAILKRKYVVFMRIKMLFTSFKYISFCFRDIQVFKLCKLAK